jgi:hypothetical protein
MKSNEKFPEHPEINDLINICSISPDSAETKDVCDILKGRKLNQLPHKTKSSKKKI